MPLSVERLVALAAEPFCMSVNAIGNKINFSSMFGATPHVCQVFWDVIDAELPISCHPSHLLWDLYFLQPYSTEEKFFGG